jgi:hypothetical protein
MCVILIFICESSALQSFQSDGSVYLMTLSLTQTAYLRSKILFLMFIFVNIYVEVNSVITTSVCGILRL